MAAYPADRGPDGGRTPAASTGDDDVRGLGEQRKIDRHHAFVDGVVHGVAIRIQEVAHYVANRAAFDNLTVITVFDEAAGERRGASDDLADAQHGHVEAGG